MRVRHQPPAYARGSDSGWIETGRGRSGVGRKDVLYEVVPEVVR